MSKHYYDPTTYTELRAVADLCTVQPFVDQRDVDVARVVPIVAKFEADVNACGRIRFDTPVVLVECAKYGSFLLDRDKKRVAAAIVDGQHRVAALDSLRSVYPKVNALVVPVFVHVVDTLAEGRRIQYQLFEQKPVDAYDRIQQRDYQLRDVVDQWVARLRRVHPDTTKRFKDGRYADKSIKPRKYHFMVDEFAHALKNSPRVSEWVRREVQCDELERGMNTLVAHQCAALEALPLEQQAAYVNIPKQSNYVLFRTYLASTPFQIMPYVYYKRYASLVHDLEAVLDLAGDEGEEGDEGDEGEFMECL